MTLTGSADLRPGLFEAAPDAVFPAGAPAPPPEPRRPRDAVPWDGGRRRRRVLPVVALLAALALLTTGVVTDLHVRSELGQARSSLASTRARLSHTRSRLTATLRTLTATTSTLTSVTGERETLRVELSLVAWELSGAESNLATAKSGLSSQQAAIAALGTCLGGVERALNQISVGQQSGAVSSISGVSTSCQSAQSQGQGGPVFPFDFPDPDVVHAQSAYYGYATNSATGNVQMIRSTDLARWTVLGDALSHLPPWARPDDTWAPGVIALGGGFDLFYAARDRKTGTECISVAVSGQPQGPFVDDSGAPLVCQPGGSIDPSPFVDSTGTPYLTWKSEASGGQRPTIWSRQLSPSGTALAGGAPSALMRPTQSWQGGVVEGPSMLLWAGKYYLFYSANNWNSAHYAIGVAVCQGPTGPCSEPSPGPILGAQPAFVSPGGPSLFTDAQGQLWMAFHAYLPSAVGFPHSRLLFLRKVTFAQGFPTLDAAS
jgi:hypothetical protein